MSIYKVLRAHTVLHVISAHVMFARHERRCLHFSKKVLILQLLNVRGNAFWNLSFIYICVIFK